MARATTQHAVLEIDHEHVSSLEYELQALRQQLHLLQLANSELESLVVRDTLTPLYNRRHFVNALEERLSRLERYGAPCVLVFMDVDAMKQINDTYGHTAGDTALVHIARLIGSSIRSNEVAARVGGDEFALLLDGLDEDDAAVKTTQLATLITETVCYFGENRLPLSASFGWTALRAGDTDFAALARADMAMYNSKRRSTAMGTSGSIDGHCSR